MVATTNTIAGLTGRELDQTVAGLIFKKNESQANRVISQ